MTSLNQRRELLDGALTASQVATLLGTSRQTSIRLWFERNLTWLILVGLILLSLLISLSR